MNSTHPEARFQRLRAQRERSVAVLRNALNAAGMTERNIAGLYSADKMLGQTPAHGYDIERIIANADKIRAALRDFDQSILGADAFEGSTQAAEAQR